MDKTETERTAAGFLRFYIFNYLSDPQQPLGIPAENGCPFFL